MISVPCFRAAGVTTLVPVTSSASRPSMSGCLRTHRPPFDAAPKQGVLLHQEVFPGCSCPCPMASAALAYGVAGSAEGRIRSLSQERHRNCGVPSRWASDKWLQFNSAILLR